MNKNNHIKLNAMLYSIFLFIFLVFVLIILHSYKKSLNISKCVINKQWNHDMIFVEKSFEKKYPIGNDFFKINHYPKYSSFFDQFVKNNYYISRNDDDIIDGTFCISELKNNLRYICDLKTHTSGNNLTFKFMYNYYYDTLFSYNCVNVMYPLFGVVMQPNKIVDKITKKYWMTKYDDLLLYQILHATYENHINMFNFIFGEHFFVEGYKKLTLESNNNELKICHIATLNDLNYIGKQQKPLTSNIDKYEIMFCLPKSNKNVKYLHDNNIYHSSIMTIFGTLSINKLNWNFIRTYMI